MSFDRTKMSGNMGSGSDVPNMYTITSSDNKAAVIADDYFLTAYQILNAGDVLIISASDATVMVKVLVSSSSTVTVEFVEVAA